MTTRCTYIRTSSGTKILCEVLKENIYDYQSYLPKMLVRAVNSDERLNEINRAIVPQAESFVSAENVQSVEIQS